MVLQNKSKLKIHPEPFKPSHLSIPPSPFSPKTPLLNIHNTRPPTRRTKTYPPPDTTATPPAPLQWLWQCHQCHRSYSLGVTRRCLEDGHHFCAGTTTVKTWRKPLRPKRLKRHRACASEFDYLGWKNWGRWRRSGRRDSIYDEDSSTSPSTSSSTSLSSWEVHDPQPPPSPSSLKDCWNACDYPSECRWGKRFGIHSPEAPAGPLTFDIVPAAALSGVDSPTADSAAPTVTPTTVEGVLNPENYTASNGSSTEKKNAKADLWDALVASATRRKSVPPSSPLAPVSEEVGGEVVEVERDGDGDVVMGSSPDTEEASSSQGLSSSPSSAALASLKGVFRKSSKMYSKSVRRVMETTGTTTTTTTTPPPLTDAGNEVEEMTPLERMKSRDSGYHSNP